MLFSRYGPPAVAAVATLCGASPMVHDVAVVRPRNELALRGKMDMMEHHLEKRLSFDFALDHSWKNQVLFAGYGLDATRPLKDITS